MATLTTQAINRAGVTEALVAATGGGDAAACSNDNYIKVANGGGSAITVTLAIPATASAYPGASYGATTVSVPNASHKLIGPLNPSLYQDPVTGLCTVTYSGVTSVTVGVFNVSAP